FSFLHSSSARLDLPSFPTRRSSDLNLVKTMRRIRRSISAHSLAQSCNEEALYTLGDLCAMAGLAPQSLEDRMALAKVLYQHPGLFTQQRSVLEGEGLTLYCLSPEWREALE